MTETNAAAGPRLDGKVALITGVSTGLGDDLAQLFAQRGAAVGLCSRTGAHLTELAERIHGAGGRALALPTDVGDLDQARAAVRKTVREFGGIDIVVHGARTRVPYATLECDDLDNWARSFQVNVLGALAVTQEATSHLRARGGGSIVFIGSMLTRKALPTMGSYAATKGTLITIARTLATELGPDNIRVNTVVPGWMYGPSIQQYFEAAAERNGTDAATEYAARASATALKRLATSADCAQAVLFFASEMSGAITGQTLDVNGGEVFV